MEFSKRVRVRKREVKRVKVVRVEVTAWGQYVKHLFTY